MDGNKDEGASVEEERGEQKKKTPGSSDERGTARCGMIVCQNADNEDKNADIMGKSAPIPGTDLTEQSNGNGSFENAAKSGWGANRASASGFSWSNMVSAVE